MTFKSGRKLIWFEQNAPNKTQVKQRRDMQSKLNVQLVRVHAPAVVFKFRTEQRCVVFFIFNSLLFSWHCCRQPVWCVINGHVEVALSHKIGLKSHVLFFTAFRKSPFRKPVLFVFIGRIFLNRLQPLMEMPTNP